MTTYVPQNVADSIANVWNDVYSKDTTANKYITLTNWQFLQTNYSLDYPVLNDYAKANPINYSQALVNGYEVEFDKNKSLTVATLTIKYSTEIVNNNYTYNYPIQISLADVSVEFSMEDIKNIGDTINYLIAELGKVRG